MPGAKVTIFNNGPLRIEGDCEIVDQEGKVFGLGGRPWPFAAAATPAIRPFATARTSARTSRVRSPQGTSLRRQSRKKAPHPKLRQSQDETLRTFGPGLSKPLLTLWIHSP